MSWRLYSLTFRLKSPLHIGFHKVMHLFRTRAYVPARPFWGALTAKLTRQLGLTDYEKIGEFLKKAMRFGYLYPSVENKIFAPSYTEEGLKFRNLAQIDFEKRFLSSLASTAIELDSLTAEEGMLHEVEFLSPYTMDGRPIFLKGLLWVSEFSEGGLSITFEGDEFYIAYKSNQIKFSELVDTLQVGGERKYGFGLLKIEGRPKKEFEKKFLEYPQKLFEKAPEGGESWLEVKKRMLDFLEELERKYERKNILIVSHGDPLWMLWGAMEGWEKEDYFKKGKKRDYIKKAELRELTFRRFPYDERGELDFHRPYIDKVKFLCPFCKKGEMIREKDVVDCWFDSGAMPFAQDHWPFSQKETLPPKYFPADFICEGIDQTRGWFYTLHAVSCLLGFGRSFKNVIALGHVLDKEGQKMSKSKGNVVNPWEMIEKYGADVLRWYFFVKSHPGDPKRFDEKDLKEIYRKFFNVVLNCLKFYKEFEPKRVKSNFPAKEVLNQWILSRTQFLIKKVEKFLENFQATEAAREIENFVIEDLSRWYIRVSKEKF